MFLDRLRRGVSHRGGECSQVDQEVAFVLMHLPLGQVEVDLAAPELWANLHAQSGLFPELASCRRAMRFPSFESPARYHPESRPTRSMVAVANEEYGLCAVENDDARYAPERVVVRSHMLGLSTMSASPATGVSNAAAPQTSQRRARA